MKKNKDKNKGEQKDNERYCNNSWNSNGNSFYTNKNLLNTSMSPIHKVDSKWVNKEYNNDQTLDQSKHPLFLF